MFAEDLAACHHAAASRLAAGKPIWRLKVDIRTLLAEYSDLEDDDLAGIAAVTTRVAAKLKAAVPQSHVNPDHADFDEDLASTIEQMESCSAQSLADDMKALALDIDGRLEEWLEVIYTWADRNRVWLGGSASGD